MSPNMAKVVCVCVRVCCFSFPFLFFCSSKCKGCESKRDVSARLSLLEQGGVRKQMTSCEKWEVFVWELEEKFRGAWGGKKGVRFQSKAPTQETSEVPVKNMPPLPLLPPFISRLTRLREILKSFIPRGVVNKFLSLHHLTEYLI